MKYIITSITLIIISICLAFAYANTQTITKAHQAYDKGEYDKAIDLYRQLGPLEIGDGRIHYNLGNFYFRNSELGKSIFHYQLASELLPRDEDVLFNLQYARDKVVDKIIDKSGWLKVLSFRSIMNQAESLYFISLLFFTFWSVSILFIYFKNEWITWIRRALLTITILSAVVVIKDFTTYEKTAVITASKAKVYSAIGKDNIILFTLHNGAEFTISRHLDHLESQWLQIALKDGKKGWIKAQDSIY